MDNFKYSMSLQLLKSFKKCGDINAVERMKFKDVIEDVDGNPKAGDTLELMKKELKKMKVAEYREEHFRKEKKT